MPLPIKSPKPSSAQAPLRRLEAAGRIGTRSKAGRRMLLQFAAFALLLAAVVCFATVLVDPLQFYRKSAIFPPVFSTEQRYQNPGLAKNYDYDTIVIGTSMTENFLPSVVDRTLGGKTMKLSMRGSTADEHYAIAKIALDTGRVKKVLWGLDYFSLKENDSEEAADFPDYLYDDNVWNDYRYWFNYSVYEMWFEGIARQALLGQNRDLELLNNWNDESLFGAERVVNSYRAAKQEEAYFGLNEEPADVLKARFDRYIYELAKSYPETEFYFFYPPYSVLRQEVWKETNEVRYRNQLELSVWMFERLDELPNAKVYNFQTETDWTYDLDLYKDLSHYKQDVNTAIAEAIGRDDPAYRMTRGNAASFAETLERQLATLVLTPDDRVLNMETAFAGGTAADVPRWSVLSAPGDDELSVPAKEAAQAIGASVLWDPETKTISLTLGSRIAKLQIGRAEAEIDGQSVPLAYAPSVVGGTALLPLRSVCEALGLPVATERPDEHTVRFTIDLG
ncbi:copper amine oxidase N-terminal domain-containing protein [Cohnella massiliensis]|uniref:copper amine oxidase N-terminal domain-containing protein n=1 Tax=Cohnella massiliensis TaxID=1816691 RepID=UPI00159391D8|nr:copper amine oxidase N-terminal domain-containing protein [Cohnella massiliensis]